MGKLDTKPVSKANPSPEAKRMGSIRDYAGNVYSQNGEDGILQEVLRRLKIDKGVCCEFGAANGKYCSNTYRLLEDGWDGYLVEADSILYDMLKLNTATFSGIKTYCLPVTPYNVNVLLPIKLDVLSIDIDGEDYSVWQAYQGKAKVVIIEINSSISPERTDVVNSPTQGTGYLPMKQLGEEKGYFLLCHTGNLIFILKEYESLFHDKEEKFDTSWLK